MSRSNQQQDPIRDLNNLLQGPGQNLTPFLHWTCDQMGPNNQATHSGRYTFGGVVVGVGQGLAINQAKYFAAIQALQYFHLHPPVAILQSLGIM